MIAPNYDYSRYCKYVCFWSWRLPCGIDSYTHCELEALDRVGMLGVVTVMLQVWILSDWVIEEICIWIFGISVNKTSSFPNLVLLKSSAAIVVVYSSICWAQHHFHTDIKVQPTNYHCNKNAVIIWGSEFQNFHQENVFWSLEVSRSVWNRVKGKLKSVNNERIQP